MSKKKITSLIISLLLVLMISSTVFAASDISLTLGPTTARSGDTVTVSGGATADTWISIKVLDSGQNIIYFDAVKSGSDGDYNGSFKVPAGTSGSLTVVAGYGSKVVNKVLTIGTGGTSDTSAPTWPQGSTLAVSNLAQTSVTLTWTAAVDNMGVTGYKIYRGSTELAAVAGSTLTYNVTGLTAAANYTFTVQAGDTAGNWSTSGPSTQATTSSSSTGGGAITTPQAVDSTTGSAAVTPSAGGKIGLGSEATVDLPANALTGTNTVELTVQKVTTPPPIPTGFKLAGNVYEFSVGGASSYSFNKDVALTFSFTPADFAAGETPVVYYYDKTGKWVGLGGTISGNTITVTVNHFTKYAVFAVKETITAGQDTNTIVPTNRVMTDVNGHWAEVSIKKLVALGAVSGYSDNSFRPDNNITRAEFATMLVKAFNLPTQNGKVFGDTAGHWAKDYIATAAADGLVNGYDADTFGPDDLITREQMAVMVVKAAKLTLVNDAAAFIDNSNISEWVAGAVATAVQNGIIKGYPDNTFIPQGNATRAEAVTVIVNALK